MYVSWDRRKFKIYATSLPSPSIYLTLSLLSPSPPISPLFPHLTPPPPPHLTPPPPSPPHSSPSFPTSLLPLLPTSLLPLLPHLTPPPPSPPHSSPSFPTSLLPLLSHLTPPPPPHLTNSKRLKMRSVSRCVKERSYNIRQRRMQTGRS